MTLLEDNLAVLRSRDPALAERIAASDPRAPIPPDVTDTAQRALAARFWDAGFPATELMVFYGCDLGYHLHDYFTKNPDHPRVVVIERSVALFRAALSRHDWRSQLADTRVAWRIGDTPGQIGPWWHAHWRAAWGNAPRRWEDIQWKPSVLRDGFYYVAMARTFADALGAADSIVGSPEDVFRGLINICGNIVNLSTAPSFESFAGRYRGIPGVAVSTGPSLDDALPYLKSVQGQVVIFAVDSAAAILLRAGIKPQFIACLERVVATKRLMSVLPPLPDTWLVAPPVVFPDAVAAYRGPHCFLSGNLNYLWLNPDTVPRWVGPSASTLAYAGLDLLGCDPIVLIGQDLAFDPSGLRTHAHGADDYIHDASKVVMHQVTKTNSPDDWVMGNSGQKVLSRAAYRIFAYALNRMILLAGKRCINAIPCHYGMRLDQAERMDPADAFALFRECPPIPALMPHPDELTRFGADRATLLKRVSDIVFWLQRRHAAELDTQLRMARFYHEHLPSAVTPALHQLYTEECRALEQATNAYLANEPLMYHFLWPFVRHKHLEIATDYYAREGCADFHDGVEVQFHRWQQWSRDVLFWTARTERMLMRALQQLAQDGHGVCNLG